MRLIDADALLDRIPNLYERREVSRWVDDAPTVDAVPVVHGRWVHHPEIGWGSTCLCSECGEKTVETVMGEPRYKFCPMCGADMRKDGDAEVVAFFKGEYEAKFFAKVLAAMLKEGGKDGKTN